MSYPCNLAIRPARHTPPSARQKPHSATAPNPATQLGSTDGRGWNKGAASAERHARAWVRKEWMHEDVGHADLSSSETSRAARAYLSLRLARGRLGMRLLSCGAELEPS